MFVGVQSGVLCAVDFFVDTALNQYHGKPVAVKKLRYAMIVLDAQNTEDFRREIRSVVPDLLKSSLILKRYNEAHG